MKKSGLNVVVMLEVDEATVVRLCTQLIGR